MEDKIATLEDLMELAARSFHVVEPCKNQKGNGTVRIPMKNYAELSYFILDVLKVSISALEADSEGVGTVRNVPNAVSGVLEKLLAIVPLEEMDLLDRIHRMALDVPDQKQSD